MGPVTTNPWLIALINMTIVFGVLITLGVLMNLLQVIDPTKKKSSAPAPVAAPKAAPAPVAAAPVKDDSEIIAVIAAAVAASGCSVDQIACVRRAGTPVWTSMARNEVQAVRHNMY
ncbi:MAG: OadG family protein [Phascolarctobacterium sp.]|nr:OadG family protein [Phascolarctobacterium sp.]